MTLRTMVRDTADGALSCAAVPRCGLGPLPPPLCRCAECTADSVLRNWPVIKRRNPISPHLGEHSLTPL
jgi:hypothetical protein